jgi:Zn-dependent peptidase ImmA (M78 family)/transcriptional regulator with XRE-family HTH domain
MEHAYVNRRVVRWARERRGFTKDALANKLKVSVQQVTQWEAGPQYPPFGKAQDLASALDIPFGYLFLSVPPIDKPALPDLRRVTPDRLPPSPEFIDLLNDIVVKHDWYVDYAKENGADQLPFVGGKSVNSPLSRTVSDIQSVIGMKELRKKAKSPSDYLRLLALSAEESGIIVMRSGVVRGNPHRKLSVIEFRGFAISDKIAPLVFINSKDALVAQIFTLAHELAHIWIGASGISNPDLGHRAAPRVPDEVIEQYCNDVAAELLVPATEFEAMWSGAIGNNDGMSQHLSRTFRVSVPVILRRALELNRIPQGEFIRLWNVHRERTKALVENRDEDESSGGNFYNTFFARNSHRLTQAVVSFVRTGHMGTLEAARLLNVRTATIPKLAERLAV